MVHDRDTQQREDNLSATTIAELQEDLSNLGRRPVQRTVAEILDLWEEVCDNGVTDRHIEDWRKMLPNARKVEENAKRVLFAHHTFKRYGDQEAENVLFDRARALGLPVQDPDEDVRIAARIHYTICEVDNLVMSRMTHHLLSSHGNNRSADPRPPHKQLTGKDRQKFADKANSAYRQVKQDNPDVSQGDLHKLTEEEYDLIRGEMREQGYRMPEDWQTVIRYARRQRSQRRQDSNGTSPQHQSPNTPEPLCNMHAENGADTAEIGSLGVVLLEALGPRIHDFQEELEDHPDDPDNVCD